MMANWYSYYGNGYTAALWPASYREHNVDIIAYYFSSLGWTINAIAGMLGNMEVESYLNPGQWEHSYPVEQTPAVGGYGLVQWTPWTNYTNWAGADYSTNFDKQLDRIKYEFDNGLQWIPTGSYPETFAQFSQSTATPSYLAMAFFKDYERGVGGETQRMNNAEYWYSYLQAHPPGPVPPPILKKMNIMLYLKPWWKL